MRVGNEPSSDGDISGVLNDGVPDEDKVRAWPRGNDVRKGEVGANPLALGFCESDPKLVL